MKQIVISLFLILLLVNTQYIWFPSMGFLQVFIFIGYIFMFIGLCILSVFHLIKTMKKRFQDKHLNILSICFLFVTSAIAYKPFGLINEDTFDSHNSLIAKNEGAANCQSILKLKASNSFVEKTHCFGSERINGVYRVYNDTIWFTSEQTFFQYGIIQDYQGNKSILLFENNEDTTPVTYRITESAF